MNVREPIRSAEVKDLRMWFGYTAVPDSASHGNIRAPSGKRSRQKVCSCLSRPCTLTGQTKKPPRSPAISAMSCPLPVRPTAGRAEVRAGEAGTAEAASAGAAATAEARNGTECRTEETMTNTDQGEAPAGTTSGATGISDSPAPGTSWYLHPVVISALVVAAATVLTAIVSLITNWITLRALSLCVRGHKML